MLLLMLLAGFIDTNDVLAVFGRFGIAHACPVSETVAYTSAHVVDPAPLNKGVPYFPLRWSARTASGIADVKDVDFYADLATVVSPSPFPGWYRTASRPPEVDSLITLVGYDYRNKERGFMERPQAYKVTRIVADHVLFDGSGGPGSSGSCILNAAGEIVAINSGYMLMDNTNKVGIGVGVWMLKTEPPAALSRNEDCKDPCLSLGPLGCICPTIP